MTIEYRPLYSVQELEQVVDLEIAVWELADRDAVPMSIMRPISAHGGHVLGAFDDDQLVGMSLAFPARAGGRWVLWSHMAAVIRERQGQGIGFGIKLAQRKWALENGYNEIRWTFDPLQPGNANFNMHLLGATANTYHVEYYGVMDDAINRDTASDRIEARWKLNDKRVVALAEGRDAPAFRGKPDASAFAVYRSDDGAPVLRQDCDDDTKWRFIEIPSAQLRSTLNSDCLNAWRMATRAALRDAFAAGYVAVDFIQGQDRAYYALRLSPRWYLYVLRCSDDSLYTGISPDVEARLRKHQAGRAAAYTASRRPVSLLGVWQYPDRPTALRAELAFKKLARAEKLAKLENRTPHHGGNWANR